MDIPFIAAMREEMVSGSRRMSKTKFTPHASVEAFALLDSPVDVSVRHYVELQFVQRVSENQWLNDKNCRVAVQKRAASALVRHLYGSIDGRLRDALEAMWEDGMAEHPSAKIIEEILATVGRS